MSAAKSIQPRDMTPQLEDYLEAIAELQQEQRVARAKDIADRLKVTRGTVTSALKSLNVKGLINYQPYSHITLTKAGEQLSAQIIHRHETLARYFREILLLPRDKAEENACRAEHVLDPEVIERMVKFLAFVDKCPRTGEAWSHAFDEYCDAGNEDSNCKECLGESLAGLYAKDA